MRKNILVCKIYASSYYEQKAGLCCNLCFFRSDCNLHETDCILHETAFKFNKRNKMQKFSANMSFGTTFYFTPGQARFIYLVSPHN